MRKLATIRKIRDIIRIPQANSIDVAYIDGWTVIVRRGDFKVGDLCMFFEVDSIIPRQSWSEFLFKNSTDQTYTLTTKYIFGVLSQGLALPLQAFNGVIHENYFKDIEHILSCDFTSFLEITKYETQYDNADILGKKDGYILSTSLERVQNVDEFILANCAKDNTKIFEKLDGETIIITYIDKIVRLYSNSVQLNIFADTPLGIWTRKNAIKLTEYFQKVNRPYILYGEYFNDEVYWFKESDTDGNESLPSDKLKFYDLKIVPEIFLTHIPSTRLGWLGMADGPSMVYNGKREGLVIWKNKKPMFKVISNSYLLNRNKNR